MSKSRALAISLSMAVAATGPALADEPPSFAARVQQSQGIGQVRGARRSADMEQTTAMAEPASFTDRAALNQGISTRGSAARESHGAPEIASEATSFIDRIKANQGVVSPSRDM